MGSVEPMTTVAIVMPFYQRDAAVVRRSLASIAAQALPGDVRLKLVMVDDASPLPVEQALAGFTLPAPHDIVVLHRPNGGPGAARNTALDALDPREIDFVAFLDSDDVWRENHLARAIAGLGGDGDFFFCDHDRWYDPLSWFAASETVQGWLAAPATAPFRVVDADEALYEFLPDRAFSAFIQDYLAQTSTVVYRFAPLAHIRFDETLRQAGEDSMFWLELAAAARKTRFVGSADIVCGEGVNMYFSTIGWDHPEAVRRLSFNILFFLKVGRRFRLAAADRRIVDERAWALQKTMMRVWMSKLVKQRQSNAASLMRLVRQRPMSALTLPTALVAALVKPT